LLESLLSSARSTRPGRAVVSYGGEALTVDELVGTVDRLVDALGVGPGGRVAIVAPNVPALVAGMLAAWRAGAVAVPLSARLRRFELERAFANAEPTAVITTRAHGGFALADEIRQLAARGSTVRALAVVDDRGEILDELALAPDAETSPSPAEIAAILYTSGTTGEPKGALVPHRMADAMVRNMPELLGEEADAAYGLVVPASHSFGLGCLLGGIAAGATTVMVDATTSVEPLLRALRENRARVLHGTPQLFGRVLRSGADVELRAGFVAGSWCPPELLQELDERGARILNLYGMTEIGAAVACRPDDPPEIRYRTVGRPLPGYELRVHGDSPEIQVRSEYLPSGYYGRAWGPDELDGGEWFRTGDLGELDDSGNLVIAGRAKEVIHVGGFNVWPAELESFLTTHPAIAQAAVIGVPHPVLGEAPQAFVVPADGATVESRDVIRFARGGVAGYKVPYTVQIVHELPLLASGKVDRRALAASQEAAAHAAQEAVR
jgi:acyl-CoA synthetase (AMP-forming)/AMP-acid ligase II